MEVSRWWRKGQWTEGGESGSSKDVLLHGGAYVKGDRAYLPYSAGGFVILDISDVKKPRLVSDLPFSPPFQSFIAVHSAVPLRGKPLVIVNSEVAPAAWCRSIPIRRSSRIACASRVRRASRRKKRAAGAAAGPRASASHSWSGSRALR